MSRDELLERLHRIYAAIDGAVEDIVLRGSQAGFQHQTWSRWNAVELTLMGHRGRPARDHDVTPATRIPPK